MKLKQIIIVVLIAVLLAELLTGCGGNITYEYDGRVELRDENGSVVLDHDDFVSAETIKNPNGEQYSVQLTFTNGGRDKFKLASAENTGKSLELFVGQYPVFSAMIAGEIDSAEILINNGGNMSKNEVRALAKNLNDNLKKYKDQPPISVPTTEPTTSAVIELQPGEILFEGNVNFSFAESFAVSFILSDDGKIIRELKIVIKNWKVEYTHGNSRTTTSGGRSELSFSNTFDVADGKIEISTANVKLSLTVNDQTIEGTVTYTYTERVSGTDIGLGEEIRIDMGTQPIVLAAAE